MTINEPIREVPEAVRKAWEPRRSGYTREQAQVDRAQRSREPSNEQPSQPEEDNDDRRPAGP